MFRERLDSRLIPTRDLSLGAMPTPDAPWGAVQAFARTFDAFLYHGSAANCLDAADATRVRWEDGSLRHAGPDELRTALHVSTVLGASSAPADPDPQFARIIIEHLRRAIATGRASKDGQEELLPACYDLDARFPYRTFIAPGVSTTYRHGRYWVVVSGVQDALPSSGFGERPLPVSVRSFATEDLRDAHLRTHHPDAAAAPRSAPIDGAGT